MSASMASAVVYLEDRFLSSPEEARVSIFDRGYLFGDSIFETLRAYDGVAYAIDAHLDRLDHASRVTGIDVPLQRDRMAALVGEAVARSGFASAYIRITISRGEGGSGVGTLGCTRPILSIVVKPFTGYPLEAYERGIDSMVVTLRKVPASCLDPAMKTGNYLPSVLARRELERVGLVEGVMLSVDGVVVSGTISNVFLVQGDRLRTPDAASGCRTGVTRATLLDLATSVGLRPVQGTIAPDELAAADEAFFSNTLMECLPIRRLDGHELGSARADSATRRLLDAYRQAIRRSAVAL